MIKRTVFFTISETETSVSGKKLFPLTKTQMETEKL